MDEIRFVVESACGLLRDFWETLHKLFHNGSKSNKIPQSSPKYRKKVLKILGIKFA